MKTTRLSPVADAIEEFFRQRYAREALYLPSGRLGLYVAFREWLSPGDRVLMSPLDDDVVFFTVLAAGLRPVLGPVDPRTGNLDPNAIGDATWSSLSAVLTTNLYGTPDRMDLLEDRCRRHRLVLLEDAAHGFDSQFAGRKVGTFGTAAVFSLSKHLEIPGGVLVFSDSDRRESVVRRAQQELRHSLSPSVTVSRWLAFLKAFTGLRRAPRGLSRVVDAVALHPGRGRAHRMPYTDEAIRAAQNPGGLDRFDPWVRMDYPAYRTPPLPAVLQASLARLQTFEKNRRARLDGARRLFDLGYMPTGLQVPREDALLRVPLFMEDRDRVIAHLSRRGVTTDYIYDPPLDAYAPQWSDALPSPPAARIWSRDVVPVNPLQAERFLAIRQEAPGLFRPIREELHSVSIRSSTHDRSSVIG